MTQPPRRPLTELTSQQVLDDTMTVLQTHLTLHADGFRCTTRDLWQIILTAVAQHSSIEAACAHLATAPDANTIRGSLTRPWSSAIIPDLEQQVNAALRAAVPTWLADTPLDLAIDTHDMPYYGRSPATNDADSWVVRGQATSGTTHHYRCATAYVIVEHARVTLAVVFMRSSDTLVNVVDRLLRTVQGAGYRIGCLYADKGFCTVAILRALQEQQIPAIIAAPIRGKQGGTRALCQGHESHWATHTFSSAEAGSATVKVAVVRTYAKRHGKKRATWCLFVCLGVGYDVIRMREDTLPLAA